MERSEVLLTIAEIAIAFAGFASIVTAFGRQRSGDDPRVDALRFRLMLESALTVVFFSLLPFIPDAFGLTDASTWRLAATAFLLWNIVGLIVGGRRSRALSQQSVPLPGRGVLGAMLFIELFIDIPLLVVILGALSEQAFALYLVALFAALLQAGISFIRVVGSLLSAATH